LVLFNFRAGPSPGFSSRGGQKPKGGAKNQKGGQVYYMPITSPYFDNLEVDIFVADGPQ